MILGSDGIWDNAHDSEVINEVKTFIEEKKVEPWGRLDSARETAWRIARLASNNAYNDDYESPFYVNSGKKPKYLGGKLDDITVIVG